MAMAAIFLGNNDPYSVQRRCQTRRNRSTKHGFKANVIGAIRNSKDFNARQEGFYHTPHSVTSFANTGQCER